MLVAAQMNSGGCLMNSGTQMNSVGYLNEFWWPPGSILATQINSGGFPDEFWVAPQ